jgi:hypothetical protein
MTREMFLNLSKPTRKQHLKGLLCWLLLHLQKERDFLNISLRAVAFVASKYTNLLIISQDLIMHTRSQGKRPMKRPLLPLYPHPNLPSPVPTARNLDIRENGVTKRRMMNGNQMIKLLLCLCSLKVGSLAKIQVTLSPKILLLLIQEQPATGSLEGMFDIKP